MLVRLDGRIFKSNKKKTPIKKSTRLGKEKRTCDVAPRPIIKKDVFYEVERVIASKIHKGGRLYLVKWAGYDSDENSWIDELPEFFKNRNGTSMELLQSGVVSDSESESSDESEDEWIEESGEKSDSGSDSESGSESGNESDNEFDNESGEDFSNSNVNASKKTKKLYQHDSSKSTGSTYVSDAKEHTETHKEKLVMKALLALSAVVGAGYACDQEDESD